MLQKAIPVLPSRNLRATIDFYETRLGFAGLNMGNYAVLRSGLAEIHLQLIADAEPLYPVSCVIYSDNIEDLFTFFASKDMLYTPGQRWDMATRYKEFSVRDNYGNIIRFSQQKNN